MFPHLAALLLLMTGTASRRLNDYGGYVHYAVMHGVLVGFAYCPSRARAAPPAWRDGRARRQAPSGCRAEPARRASRRMVQAAGRSEARKPVVRVGGVPSTLSKGLVVNG